MASKEYKDKLRLENPEKYQLIYGTGAKKKYLKNLKDKDYKKFRDMANTQKRKYRKSNSDKVKNERLSYKYGITIQEFDLLLQKQGNRCGACKEEFKSTKSTHLDHCHGTNKVRGMLCINCNVSLGYAKDNIERLQGLIEYLKEHGNIQI